MALAEALLTRTQWYQELNLAVTLREQEEFRNHLSACRRMVWHVCACVYWLVKQCYNLTNCVNGSHNIVIMIELNQEGP